MKVIWMREREIEYKSPAPINSTQPEKDPHALFPADPFVRLEVPAKSWTVPKLLTLEFNQPTSRPTTSSHEYQLLSWTDIVNREWSTAFLVCSFVILTIMIVMVVFALSMFVYLQTKPKRGRRLHSVDD
uniref:Protein UL42 n=1 Tax=Heterorhabditis bacteriophora TaxID=37862 RepID=A0A1I7WBM9_HETBA